MKPAPRPVRPPPQAVAVAAGVVLLSGGSIIAVPDASRSDGLTARTIAHLLARAAPDGATDVRVNGIYGSAHEGTWQFVASLTWRDAEGAVSGGTTELPQNGGQPPLPTQFTQERLEHEHRIGWTIPRLRRALRDVEVGTAGLAMLELEITAANGQTVVFCVGEHPGQSARCSARDADGEVVRLFTDRLLDVPGLDAVSVQRESAPVTATP